LSERRPPAIVAARVRFFVMWMLATIAPSPFAEIGC
jgi:hypothetical protein